MIEVKNPERTDSPERTKYTRRYTDRVKIRD